MFPVRVNFVSPQWFVTIGAVALPVAVHLIRREQFKRCEIATLRFLAEAVRERGGRQRLSNWPLFLLRAMTVCALALLFTRPFRNDADAAPMTAGETIILADVSGSQARRDAPSLPALAKKHVAQAPPNSRVTLARFADRVKIVHTAGDLQPVPGTAADFNRAVAWAIDHRAQSGGQPARIVFLSDFPQQALRTLSPRLWPPGTTIELAPTGDEAAWNIGVERVELLTPVAVSDLEVEVSLGAGGQPPREPVRVRLQMDGRAPMEQQLPAGQRRARFHWQEQVPRDGLLLQGWAEIVPPSGDAIAADDRRPFAASVARQRTVLLVDGDPGESVYSGETYFVDKALKAVSRPDEIPQFHTEIRLRPGDLSGFDAVALCNLAALTSAEAESVGRYVSGGGSLFVSIGNQTQPELFDALAAAGVAFGRASRISAPAASTNASVAANSPVFGRLGARFERSWRELTFWRSLDLQPAQGAKTLAAFESRAPLLIEAAPAGAGKAVAFLHSVDRQDSELPRDPLFVPFVRELFRFLSGGAETARTIRETTVAMSDPRVPGIYPAEKEVEVVSPDPAEIDLSPASLAEARSALSLAVQPPASSDSPTIAALTATAPSRLHPHELWPAAALALFALLILESLLASRSPAARKA